MSTTIVDKQEIKSSGAAVSGAGKREQQAPIAAQVPAILMEAKPAAAEPADWYRSCLDLAAEFLARG